MNSRTMEHIKQILDAYISTNYTKIINRIIKSKFDLLDLDPEAVVAKTYLNVVNALSKSNYIPDSMDAYFWTAVKSTIYCNYRDNKKHLHLDLIDEVLEPEMSDRPAKMTKINRLYDIIIDLVDKSDFNEMEKFIFLIYTKSIITGNKISGTKLAELSGCSKSFIYASINKIKNYINSNKTVLEMKDEL